MLRLGKLLLQTSCVTALLCVSLSRKEGRSMPINMAAEKILVSASTGVINSVLGKLANLIAKEFAMLKDVRKQAEFLHEELSSMGALLEDLADVEGLDNQTMHWKNKVREMSYDIEDCLDDFTRRVGDPYAGKGLLRRLKTLRARHQLANQIQELKTRVDEASERRKRYKLDERMSRSCKVTIDPRVTALYEVTSKLVGIDGPKEEVINLLEKEVDGVSVQQLRVVSIVGLGGLGKTTLANEVYNKFGESFVCKAFVSVSQRPDMTMLLKSLSKQILGSDAHSHELQGLIDNIRKFLRRRRYLVVVDDLWDPLAWKTIKCAFPEGHFGSRVLTTTRIKGVAMTCCNFEVEFVYKLKPLDEHNSRQLFYRRVFGLENACPGAFEEPSDKILQKCGGMPLAIISIASLLASQSNISMEHWDYVLNSLRSDLSLNPDLEGMIQILNLSYTHLPHHLKTCLLYIGMYPEDDDIKKDHLVMQWVAEGFVKGLDGRDAVEIAESYLNELVNRGMIIQVKYPFWNQGISYKVHDIFLNLILSKSEEEKFLCVVPNLQTIAKGQHRRLSLQINGPGLEENEARTMSLPQIRSLFTFGLPLWSLQLYELKFVRVLFVYRVRCLDLTPITKLFQLRYLYVEDERRSSIVQLPKQICQLQHLETLIIGGLLYHLPHDIVDLPALSYLKFHSGVTYPDGIGRMKSLHTLNTFNPSKQSVDNLRALGSLLNLRKLDIFIYGSFPTGETHVDALLSSIEKLINCNLRRLTIWGSETTRKHYYDGWNSLSLSGGHLEQLCLDLTFRGLPAWMSQLSTLSRLEIHLQELCKDDIAVLAGLLVLVDLRMWVCHVPQEGIVFGNGVAFRALDYFEFSEGCLIFESGVMPKVETLSLTMRVEEVKRCGIKLSGIRHLPNLKRIAIDLHHKRVCSYSNGVYTASIVDEEDAVGAEDAIRSFFHDEHHPGRPTIHIRLK